MVTNRRRLFLDKPATEPLHALTPRLNPGWLQKHVFNAALKALKLPAGRKEGYTPYDLKRTALRTIRRSGIPEERAMRISGHLTSSTFRRYNLTDVEDLRQDLARRDEYLRKQRRES